MKRYGALPLFYYWSAMAAIRRGVLWPLGGNSAWKQPPFRASCELWIKNRRD